MAKEEGERGRLFEDLGERTGTKETKIENFFSKRVVFFPSFNCSTSFGPHKGSSARMTALLSSYQGQRSPIRAGLSTTHGIYCVVTERRRHRQKHRQTLNTEEGDGKEMHGFTPPVMPKQACYLLRQQDGVGGCP